MQLVDRIERLLLNRDAVAAYNPDVQQELRDIWRLLGKEITRPNCQDCLYNALIDLRKLNLNAMKNRKAQIKAGEHIRLFGESVTLDNVNLTDAEARRALAEYPGLAESFEVLPGEAVEGDEDYIAPKAQAKPKEVPATGDKKE